MQNRFVFIFLMVGAIALALLISFVVIGKNVEQRLLPGIWVWDVPVGGLSSELAHSTIVDAFDLTTPRVVLVAIGEQRWAFSPADLGLSVDSKATLARAYAPGHERANGGDILLFERLKVMQRGKVVAPVFAWDTQQAIAKLETLASELNAPPQDAQISLEGGELHVMPASLGCYVDITATLQLLEPLLQQPGSVELPLVIHLPEPELSDDEASQALDVAQTILAAPLQLLLPDPQEGDPGPWTLTPEVLGPMLRMRSEDGRAWAVLDEVALTKFLAPFQLALRREPVDARFEFDEETGQLFAVSESHVGRELDVEATIARINEQVRVGQHLVPMVLKEIPPRYPETIEAEELGIQEVVAVGESYFSGSSSARDRNIRIGASKFDGILIAPGDTFSFNAFLGDVTPAEGYDESYVIVGNRTVPGIGGGICQVATTAFRAAFYGGYEIVERWPHAYRVAYYELGGYGPGFDATIYSPLVDFRFTNDTKTHLLIHTEVDSEESRLRFVFYGTSDGRTVEQIGPTWGNPEPAGPPIYEYDPDMPAGSVELLERSHEGLMATLERAVKDAEGQVLHHDRFTSHFVPWSARYRYGEGFTPPPGVTVIEDE